MKRPQTLPDELRSLVRQAVAVLGSVIQNELGREAYLEIESLRQQMAGLRGKSQDELYRTLSRALEALSKVPPAERQCLVHSYALMLELMNSCENAYRTYRLRQRRPTHPRKKPRSIIYVLTAHPTEARSPANIAVFHEIQAVLIDVLRTDFQTQEPKLRHLLEVAWNLALARGRKPSIHDEAEHIYSIVLRDETLSVLLASERDLGSIYIRSWVGGDKDGHPGVDEKVMLESLRLSRARLLSFARERVSRVRATARTLSSASIVKSCAKLERTLSGVAELRAGDGAKIRRVRALVRELLGEYVGVVSAPHPALIELDRLVRLFPALVVPLELRESSDVLVPAAAGLASKGKRAPAIVRMVRALGAVSRGGHPRWYARGFIISMASTVEHILAAKKILKSELHALSIPIIPLFEQYGALEHGHRVVEHMLRDREIRPAVDEHWRGYFEVMLGYSDSAKESGVIASRLAIADAMNRLDRVIRRHKVIPVFFQGSGGSVDRGGGSIEEQTAWWPLSALNMFKATIQGEMVERTFSSPEITRGQLEKIAERYEEVLVSHAKSAQVAEPVRRFADKVAASYRAKVTSSTFPELVERGTAYRYLSLLRIGSRPSKRAAPGKAVEISSLRAIPWVMCWTQTRVLFPTWWGVGTAWKTSKARERAALKRAFARDAFFRSYVKLLAFTLAKVELPVWRLYLEHSGLDRGFISATIAEFSRELEAAKTFVRAMSGSRDLLWFRPWLATSIQLRSPMIHPINLVQILVLRERKPELIRETVTGISSGMMTTG